MNIFDMYTSQELKDNLKKPTEEWSEDFLLFVNDIIASELLDDWLENTTEEEYINRVKEIVEYYPTISDDDEEIETDKQLRLFD